MKQSLAELVKAIDANPFDAAPHLLSAEILRNVGRPDDAIASYERAVEILPEGAARHAAEAKLARLVVEQSKLNSTDRAAGEADAQPLDRSGTATIAASVIVPGLGQWIAGRHVKGVILFLLWIASIAVAPAIQRSAGLVVCWAPYCIVVLAAVLDSYVEVSRAARKR
jgi:tetratricopeptide (TPR) repeat protein